MEIKGENVELISISTWSEGPSLLPLHPDGGGGGLN
jgi:hypothetical protein